MWRFTPARLLSLVVVLGVCAAGLLTQIQTRASLYRTPFAEALPWGPPGPALSERVVICLVDGLREDTSRAQDSLNALRRQGADWTLTVTPPSYSIPLSHVIATGAPQSTIGMLTNRAPIGRGFYETFGTIYTAAGRVGLRTGNVVTWRPGYALEPLLDAPHTLPGGPGDSDDDGVVPRVLEVLAQPDAPNLLWVHFDIVDRAGHVAGGASDAYAAAAHKTAERIGRIANAVDFSRETLIVTADHGHLDRGGHGGSEPEVVRVPCILAGAGVAAGRAGTGEQIDLAATVAWLLGAPIPTHSEGWPLAQALAMSPETRARRGRDTVVQRLDAYRFRLLRLGIVDERLDAPLPAGLRTAPIDDALAAGRWDVAWAQAANLALDLRGRWRWWLARVAERWLQPRLYAAIGFGLLAFVTSVVARRRAVGAGAPPAKNPPAWLLGGVVIGAGVPTLLFLAAGNGYSLSAPGRGGLGPFGAARCVEGAVGLVAGSVVARLLVRPRGRAREPFGIVLAGVAGALAAIAVTVAAVFLVGFGLDPHPWQQRRPTATAVLLVVLLQFLGIAACAFPGAVVVAIRAGRGASAEGDASGERVRSKRR